MLAWRANPNKTIKDPMAKSKEITERLLKEGNQSALSRLPVLAEQYRKARASGNATQISNARIGLITVMQEGGLVTPLEAARAVDADLIITVGGGSVTDAGKVFALGLKHGFEKHEDFEGFYVYVDEAGYSGLYVSG